VNSSTSQLLTTSYGIRFRRKSMVERRGQQQRAVGKLEECEFRSED